MGQELEDLVLFLLKEEKERKEIGKVFRVAEKRYQETYDKIVAMLKAGHKLPRNSPVYSQIVEEPYGRSNPAEVLKLIKQKYPNLANQIQILEKEIKNRIVEKLDYGHKE